MSENQYDAPAMEVVELGSEDIIACSGIDYGPGLEGGGL